MLTVAQMFLLNTCVALLFFSWMWSSAASTTVVLPLATCAPHHGGDAQAGGDTPLCGSEAAPHPLLGPGEVTWEEAESPSWQVNISRPTSRWRLRMQHLKLACSWGSQHSPVLTEIFQVKISLGWISWRRTSCWCCYRGVNYEPWLCGVCLKAPAGTTGSVDSTSLWAPQTLLNIIEKKDNPEELTKLTLRAGTTWSSRPHSHQSHSMILCITTMRCFILFFLI